jgi:hypothetical protein
MEAQSAKSEPAPAPTSPPAGPAVPVVTLPNEELAWAQARAERAGTTVSAVVTDAVRQARQAEAWAEFRDWALQGQPPISDDERAAAEREWRG